MDDPMSDRGERMVLAFDPLDDLAEQTPAGVFQVGMAPFEQELPGGILHGEPRVSLVLVQRAFVGQPRIAAARHFEQREFDAGRACVQDENGIGHCRSFQGTSKCSDLQVSCRLPQLSCKASSTAEFPAYPRRVPGYSGRARSVCRGTVAGYG